MPNDYLAVIVEEPEDAEHVGVKGMKWGVRRSREERKTAAAKRKTEDDTPKPTATTTKPAATTTKLSTHEGPETSSERYARLAGVAKAGKAADMNEPDLKFFNSRTEALNKVNKMNEVKPTWLQETSKTVLQETAKKTMQSVSDTLATKYIGGPITEAIKGTAKKT